MVTQRSSVIVVTYNSKEFIINCIDSILKESPLEVIVVDNDSQDQTKTLVADKFPQVSLIANKDNQGYGRACNIGAQNAKGEIVVFMNPDTQGTPGWLDNLLKPLELADKSIVTPAIKSKKGGEIILGNLEHLMGFGFTNSLNPGNLKEFRAPSGFSGCCFALLTDDWKKLGGFDEAFFLYMEDVELSWRAFAKGFRIVGCSESLIIHDYDYRIDPNKVFLLEKGRYIIIKKYYTKSTLIRLLPSFLISEILAWGFGAALGREGVRSKLLATLEGIKWNGKKDVVDQFPLIMSRESKIPEFTSGQRIDEIARKLANIIYEANLKVLIK